LLSFETLKVRTWPASSAPPPGEMSVAKPGTVCAPAFSVTVWLGPMVKLGASLTGFTVMVKFCGALVSLPPLAVPPSSDSVTVMVALPLALAAGV